MRTVSLKERISENVAAPRMPGRISGSSMSTNPRRPVRAAHPRRLEIHRIEGCHGDKNNDSREGERPYRLNDRDGDERRRNADEVEKERRREAGAHPGDEQRQKHERQDQPGRRQLANGHRCGEAESGAIRATIPPTSSDVTIAFVSTGFRHIWAYRERVKAGRPPHPSRPRRRAAVGAEDR